MTTVAPLRTVVAWAISRAALDDALDGADWPTWTGRVEGCPAAVKPIPGRCREGLAHKQVTVPDQCLAFAPMSPGDWGALWTELMYVAPEAMRDLYRRGLIYEHPITGAGVERYLLGLTVG